MTPARKAEQGEAVEQQFHGFSEKAFGFFPKLARNNRREWFAEHKAEYEETLLAPMLLLVQDLAAALHEAGLPLEPQRRTPVRRIYRDIRFSPNKSPFQTHISAALFREGDKSQDGVLYVHLDGRSPFMAAGFWQPEKRALLRWRESIAADAAPLLRIAKDLPLARGDTLTRMPRGFERHADSPAAALLQLKSFVVEAPVESSELHSRAVLSSLCGFAEQAAPLLRYGWSLE